MKRRGLSEVTSFPEMKERKIFKNIIYNVI